MPSDTKHYIANHAITLFARTGYEGFSMRTLAQVSGVGLSSIYHFYPDKDTLLTELFRSLTRSLGKLRLALPKRLTASDLLKDRINFQFQNAEYVVFLLKYYLHFRERFDEHHHDYLPMKATLHIEEVLEAGVTSGEFSIRPETLGAEAKVIAHAINGYLLEFYPQIPEGRELDEIIQSIHTFVLRSLKYKEGAV